MSCYFNNFLWQIFANQLNDFYNTQAKTSKVCLQDLVNPRFSVNSDIKVQF